MGQHPPLDHDHNMCQKRVLLEIWNKTVVKIIYHLLEAKPRSKHVFDQVLGQSPDEIHLFLLGWEKNLSSKLRIA